MSYMLCLTFKRLVMTVVRRDISGFIMHLKSSKNLVSTLLSMLNICWVSGKLGGGVLPVLVAATSAYE
jgi:hypothetical protein